MVKLLLAVSMAVSLIVINMNKLNIYPTIYKLKLPARYTQWDEVLHFHWGRPENELQNQIKKYKLAILALKNTLYNSHLKYYV